MKRVCLMIPCHNEEKAIGHLLNSINHHKLKEKGYLINVLVIDNNSKDKTKEIAEKHGAKVVFEPKIGKGNAIKTGFANIGDVDYVVMLDGDMTYLPSEMPRLLEILDSNFGDAVVGSRLEGKIVGKAMSHSHRIANWFFTFLTRTFYKANITDTCSGYFAWKKEVIEKLSKSIESTGFAIEAEMITKLSKMGFKIYSVPITYIRRRGDSKLSPLLDGIKITSMIIKNIWWKPKK